MQYTLSQLRQHLHRNVYEVYDIFKNFFGEDKVDLQEHLPRNLANTLRNLGIQNIDVEKPDLLYDIPDNTLSEVEKIYERDKNVIYVWWPKVIVTNENNKSVTIQDLYAKIDIQFNGRIPYEYIGFSLNRATYTKEQFQSNYLHSHIQDIPKTCFREFMTPCLGNGPIKNTIGTLKNEYSDVLWMLFCQELNLYVSVESLRGGPWRRLEEIGSTHRAYRYMGYNYEQSKITGFLEIFPNDTLKNFIKYYLKHGHLSLRYINGHFTWGMHYHEYIIDVSNSFIEYYNRYLRQSVIDTQNLFRKGLLNKVIFSNGMFHTTNADMIYDFDNYRGQPVLKFKGKDITIAILENNNHSDSTITTVLSQEVAMYILKNTLRTINFRYKNEYYDKNKDAQSSPTASSRVIYL